MKRITGIEPAFPAWEADVLPLHHIRRYLGKLIRDMTYYNIKLKNVHLFSTLVSEIPSEVAGGSLQTFPYPFGIQQSPAFGNEVFTNLTVVIFFEDHVPEYGGVGPEGCIHCLVGRGGP